MIKLISEIPLRIFLYMFYFLAILGVGVCSYGLAVDEKFHIAFGSVVLAILAIKTIIYLSYSNTCKEC